MIFLAYLTLIVFNLFSCRRVPWPHVDEGSGRADAERAEQEQQLLRRMDPQQREDRRVRHPSPWTQDGLHLRRQLHRHPGDFQEDQRAVHRYVQKEGFPPLVHRYGYIHNYRTNIFLHVTIFKVFY